ncbi:MAG TPA: hypothetical protein VLV78_07590 [Thermoanaerobaculia bacterium]|nr:hypothetical protein [Thermoanaerobaculia bacterium]
MPAATTVMLDLPGGHDFVEVFPPDSNELAAATSIDLGPIPSDVLDSTISANRCEVVGGVILDANTRRGIAGATVSFFHQTLTAADDGAYSISLGCLPPANTRDQLTVEHPAYPTFQTPMYVPTYSTELDIQLQPR